MKIHPTFHVSQLRLYKESEVFKDREEEPLPPLEINDDQEYEVEAIIAKR